MPSRLIAHRLMRESMLFAFFRLGFDITVEDMDQLSEAVASRYSQSRWYDEEESIKMTQRQLDILRLCAEGNTNAEVGAILNITEHTVKTHLRNLGKKMGARNGTNNMIALAFKYGMLTPEDISAGGPPRPVAPSQIKNSPTLALNDNEHLAATGHLERPEDVHMIRSIRQMIPSVPIKHIKLVLRALRYLRMHSARKDGH